MTRLAYALAALVEVRSSQPTNPQQTNNPAPSFTLHSVYMETQVSLCQLNSTVMTPKMG